MHGEADTKGPPTRIPQVARRPTNDPIKGAIVVYTLGIRLLLKTSGA